MLLGVGTEKKNGKEVARGHALVHALGVNTETVPSPPATIPPRPECPYEAVRLSVDLKRKDSARMRALLAVAGAAGL